MRRVATLLLLLAVCSWPATAFADPREVGTDGPDVMKGSASNDYFFAKGGNDELYGRGGRDRLLGGKGADLVVGGDRGDELYGMRGNDALRGGGGSDYLDGDVGRDAAYAGAGNDYLVDIVGGDLLVGGRGADNGYFDERKRGRTGDVTLRLGPGDDQFLVHPDGNIDHVYCGDGDDVIYWADEPDPNDVLSGCVSYEEYLGP